MKSEILDLINEKNLIKAEEMLQIYKTLEESDPDIYNIEALILYYKGELDNAINILKIGIDKFPYNLGILKNLSSLFDFMGEKINAIEFFCIGKLHSTVGIFYDDVPERFKDTSNDIDIVYGTMEIANQMNIMTRTLRKQGYNAKCLSYYNTVFKYESDESYDINKFNNLDEANKFFKSIAGKYIANNNIFHFYFGTSLTLDYSDIFLINALGKKCIMQYWGSDVRLYSKAVKLNPYIKVKNQNEDDIKRKLEFLGKYIPQCIVDYELREYVKDYHENIKLMPIAIDLDKFYYKEKDSSLKEKLLIVHAPTAPREKGSEFILKAIENLRNKYDFNFKLIYQMPHSQAKEYYAQADIIIDQVLTGSYGMFAVEAMAMGKPVICWISDFMKEMYPKELPIITANPDNIESVLEECIRNRDMLGEIGKKSRKYVEKHHDANVICSNIINIYNDL